MKTSWSCRYRKNSNKYVAAHQEHYYRGMEESMQDEGCHCSVEHLAGGELVYLLLK